MKTTRILAALATATVLFAGCGGSSDSTSTSDTAAPVASNNAQQTTKTDTAAESDTAANGTAAESDTAAASGGGADAADYDEVRTQLQETIATQLAGGAPFDITDGEIDCLSGKLGVPVNELTAMNDPSRSEEVGTAFMRCLSPESLQSLYSSQLNGGGSATPANVSECMVDKMVAQTTEWQKTDQSLTELQSEQATPEFAQSLTECATG